MLLTQQKICIILTAVFGSFMYVFITKFQQFPRINLSLFHSSQSIFPNFNSSNNLFGSEPNNEVNLMEKAELITYVKYVDSASNFKVPNVVHYIWFGNGPFSYLNYISFLSVHKYQKPNKIFIHGEMLPIGNWWDKVKKEVANIYFVPKKRPKKIAGIAIKFIQHSADIVRLQILYEYGGIYIDTDYLILRSLNPLMKKYHTVLGRDDKKIVATGCILAKKNSKFLNIWIESYNRYNPKSWSANSVVMAHTLSGMFPHLVHVEAESLMRPFFKEQKLMFKARFDWSKNYGMHIWHRQNHVPIGPEEIQTNKTTIGEVFRHVQYGSSKIRKKP